MTDDDDDTKTLREISAELGISTQRASVILASALKKARRALEEKGISTCDDCLPDREISKAD